MLITCKTYTFELCFDGAHFVVTNLSNQHCKTRLCAGHWINDLGRRVVDQAFIDCWEQGVREWQALHKSAPRPTRQRLRMGDQVRPLPVVRYPKARGEGNRYE